MALSEENILQHLFGTTSLADVSIDQFKQVTDAHPYFGAAHFLLAKKLYLSKDQGYQEALQKAALHFQNSLWLHFNLNEEDENLASEPYKFPNEENDLVEEYAEEDDAVNKKLSSMLQQHVAAYETPVETATEITVEQTPYHRVDYFDSQGIKLEEEKANDKLSSQLKKFTDWLKQMKRINPNPVDLGNDEAAETQVKNIAEHSNEGEEIVTEAMADVLIKQGKPQQAIQIYQKLSFNNPSKSAYFAAKIEELKG